MSISFWLWSHISFALIAAFLLLPLLRRLSSPRVKAAILGAMAVLGFLPLGSTDFSGYLLAHTGALSSTSLFLWSWWILASIKLIDPPAIHEQRTIILGALGLGVFLYPAALGFLTFDPYRLGFEWHFGAVVLAFSLVAALRNYVATAICLALAVVSWQLQLHESVNLWDYLIDPWLCFGFLGQTIAFLYHSATKGSQSSENKPLTINNAT